MSDRIAKFLAGALIILGTTYLMANLHRAVVSGNFIYVYDTMTGQVSAACVGMDCQTPNQK
jgi:hypothetical protein